MKNETHCFCTAWAPVLTVKDFRYKVAVLGHNQGHLITSLDKQQTNNCQFSNSCAGNTTLMFTRQGTEIRNAGKQLYNTNSVYRKTVDVLSGKIKNCHTYFGLFSSENEAIENEVAQSRLFILGYGLADMWQQFGVKLTQLVGHSFGEYTAAAFSNAMNLDDVCKFVTARGKLIGDFVTICKMAAITAPKQLVELFLEKFIERHTYALISIAAENSGKQMVIAGENKTVDIITEQFTEFGYNITKFKGAFHSPYMKTIKESFYEFASSVTYKPPRIPIVSTLTGKYISEFSAAYWTEQLVSPVAFKTAIETLRATPSKSYLEIGPTPVLTTLAQGINSNLSVTWLNSLNPKQSNWYSILRNLSKTFLNSMQVNFSQIFHSVFNKHILASLPFY